MPYRERAIRRCEVEAKLALLSRFGGLPPLPPLPRQAEYIASAGRWRRDLAATRLPFHRLGLAAMAEEITLACSRPEPRVGLRRDPADLLDGRARLKKTAPSCSTHRRR